MLYLSIIVPAYNSESTLVGCLMSIRQSAYKDYELIVADDASTDSTFAIANKYADKVVQLKERACRGHVRNKALELAQGGIVVNIDSDILIRPDTLQKIADYFRAHPETDAVTGLLSKEHPNPDFFSQYKNLYMHYIFKQLPEQVSFLYGSIHALRKSASMPYDPGINIADDTALGQRLVNEGKRIVFLGDLEVVHLKRYNARAFFKNDFQVPFDWARIFIKYKGWQQLGKNKTGYAHSPKGQLLSVMLAWLVFLLPLPAGLLWLGLNLKFLGALYKEKGFLFASKGLIVTYLDHLTMALGILCGVLNFKFGKANRYV